VSGGVGTAAGYGNVVQILGLSMEYWRREKAVAKFVVDDRL
jgi:hypothetical protein